VTRDNETYPVQKGESTFIPINAKHRVENPGEGPLQIIEFKMATTSKKTTSKDSKMIMAAAPDVVIRLLCYSETARNNLLADHSVPNGSVIN